MLFSGKPPPCCFIGVHTSTTFLLRKDSLSALRVLAQHEAIARAPDSNRTEAAFDIVDGGAPAARYSGSAAGAGGQRE